MRRNTLPNGKDSKRATSVQASVKVAVIVSEVLYHETGSQAFSTVPVQKGIGAKNSLALIFEPSLVKDRDPLGGGSLWNPALNQIVGSINSWVDARFKPPHPDNTKYTYHGNYFELDPLQRSAQTTSADKDFVYNGNHALRSQHGSFPGAVNQVLKDALKMNPVLVSKRYGLSSALAPLSNTTRVATSSVEDLAGKNIFQLKVDLQDSTGKTFLLGTKSYKFGAAAEGNAPVMLSTLERSPNAFPSQPSFSSIKKRYDAVGRLIVSDDPDEGIERHLYDDAGRLRFAQDADDGANSRVQYFVYDGLSRMVQSGVFTPPLKGGWDAEVLSTYLNDDPGKLPGGVLLKQLTYNPQTKEVNNNLNRLVQMSTWNQGNVQGSQRLAKLVQTFEYDDRGRTIATAIQKLEDPIHTTTYGYNNLGRPTSIVYPGNPSPLTLLYNYNLNGQTKCIVSDTGKIYGMYTYGADGKVATEELLDQKMIRSFTYNTLNQLTYIRDVFQGSALFQETLEYRNSSGMYLDGNLVKAQYNYFGNKVGSFVPQDHFYEYTYNAFGRLTAAQAFLSDQKKTPKPEWSFSEAAKGSGYDNNGNLNKILYRNQPTQYSYESSRNRVKNVSNGEAKGDYSYYDHGFTKKGPRWKTDAVYDLNAKLPLNLQTKDGVPIVFSYDPQGERFEKSVQYQRDPIKVTYLRGLGTHPLVERYEQGTNTEQNVYVYGPMGLIAVNDFGVSRDHLGSTRLIYDQNGNLEANFNYESFGGFQTGHHFSLQAIPGGVRYLYSRQEWDVEVQSYNYHRRHYDPTLGRFLTPDPANQFSSPYVYVGNNPGNAIDPTGSFTVDVKLWQLRLATSALRTGIGTVAGLGVGGIIGAGAMVGENIVVPAYREYEARRAGGAGFPAVLYNPNQQTKILGVTYKSGKLGAQMIAERAGIPRRLWRELIRPFDDPNLQTLTDAQIGPPGRNPNFNGRIIVVGHGMQNAMLETDYRVVNGLGISERVDGNKFVDTLNNRGLNWDHVDNLDFCVCYAGADPAHGNSFAQTVKDRLAAAPIMGGYGRNIPIRAARIGTTPVGSMGMLGEIRAGGSLGGELLSWILLGTVSFGTPDIDTAVLNGPVWRLF